MILSISKTRLFKLWATANLLFVVACAHPNKNAELIEAKPLPKEITYLTGPEVKSNEYFEDVTKEYGLDNQKAVHLYAVDLNNDHFTDLVTLEDYYSAPKFFIFDSKLNRFVQMKSPFNQTVRASFLNFVDLDHDGILDVIVGSLNQKTEMTKYAARIFKGEFKDGEIHFVETPSNFPVLPTSNISVLDYDLDGNLDLFFANWFLYKDNSPTIIPNMLFKGSGLNFENVTDLLVSETDKNRSTKQFSNLAPTFGASICDVDQNGFPDILTNSSNGYFNKMWLNLDKNNMREFLNFGNESGYAADDDGTLEVRGGGNSFFTACADYNNDGIIDLAVGNLFHDRDLEMRDRSAVLTGSTFKFPPKFIRTEIYQNENKPNWSEGDRRGVFLDYNLDGQDDLIIDNSGFPPDSRLIFFEQSSDHAYDDQAKKLGVNVLNPSGTIAIDINQDGVMDFITGQTSSRSADSNQRIYVFLNKFKREKRGSVRFHLQGRLANSQGISGSVYLKTKERQYFKNVSYNYGSLPSQNEEGLYFAFNLETPIEVKVNWPVSTTDRLSHTIPLVKKYSLKKFNLKKTHHEFNLCEDGRILDRKVNCY